MKYTSAMNQKISRRKAWGIAMLALGFAFAPALYQVIYLTNFMPSTYENQYRRLELMYVSVPALACPVLIISGLYLVVHKNKPPIATNVVTQYALAVKKRRQELVANWGLLVIMGIIFALDLWYLVSYVMEVGGLSGLGWHFIIGYTPELVLLMTLGIIISRVVAIRRLLSTK